MGPPLRVGAVFLCGAFAFLELYCTQPLLPRLAHVFRASEASAGLTISTSTLGVAICAAWLALFGERFDRKRVIVGAMAALAVVTALTATAPDLLALAAWRFAQGLLTPLIFILTIAYITEEWRPLQIPRVMSVYVAGTVFGGFLGRVAGGILAEHLGWKAMFLLLGIAGAPGALATHRLLRPAARKQLPQFTVSPLQPVVRNLQNKRLLATFGIGFCMLFTLVSVFSYITFYLSGPPFSLSTTALSWLFSVYLFGLAATLAAGTILARIGLRHGMLAAIVLSIAGVLITLLPSLVAVGVGLALTSSGVFIAQTCANSFLRVAAPAGSRVSAAGMYICAYYLGGSIGGFLPGLWWGIGGWQLSSGVVCLVLTAAAFLAFFGWRSPEPDPMPL